MRRSMVICWVGIACLTGGVALGQDTPQKPPDDRARLDRLEKDLERTRAELDDLRKKQGGGPSAAAQGEKFEKKFGKDGIPVWNNGWSLVFLDDKEEDPEKRVKHRFQVSGRVMADYRAFVDDDHPQNDRFFLRRARITASGTLYKYHDFIMEVEMGQFGAGVAEGWLQLAYWKEFQLRAGQIKPPFSLERYGSSRYLNFIERGMSKRWTDVDFDVGAMAHGVVGGIVTWQLAVMNGTGTGRADNNESKDVGGRIMFHPFGLNKPDTPELIVGGAYLTGHQTDFVPTFRTEAVDGNANPSGKSQIIDITAGLPKTAAGAQLGTWQSGQRRLWELEARLNVGPFTIQSEYTSMLVEDYRPKAGPEARVDLRVQGAYVDLLFMLTGEPYPFSKRVIPKDNFDPHTGGMGAWQLGVRYDHLHIDGSDAQLLGAKGANEVHELVAGVNWYLNPLLKLQVNYSRSWFTDPPSYLTRREGEDVVYARLAIEF